MYAVDLHVHTRFFHSWPGEPTAFDHVGARLAALAARSRGLDGIALTNHDYFEPFDTLGITAIPGIEISTSAGHVLVIGPDPPRRTDPGELSPGDAVDLAHDHGCVALIAHPFRNSTVRESDASFDAMELNGKHADTHTRVRPLANDRNLSLTGGSDAHFPFEVGRGFTRIDAEELTPESVVSAIRDGRVDPVYQGGPVDRALAPLYRLVHEQKGHRT